MVYYTGSVSAVPTTNKQEYVKHANAAWTLFHNHGATRMVETWGVAVPKGKVNDFYSAVKAKEDETIVYSWLEWPDKTTADAAWQEMQKDATMKAMPQMPFDGSRMIYGGFEPIFVEGTDKDMG